MISGGGALTKDTSVSTLTLTGADTYTGGTTITAHAPNRQWRATGSITGNVTDNATLVFDSSNGTFSGVVSGSGSIVNEGTISGATSAAASLSPGRLRR